MTSDQDVTANFEPSSYILTVTLSDNGTVTSSPSGIDCGSECSHTYDVDEQVTLTASPEEGLVFAGWSGACEGTENCVVSMTSTQNVTATFQYPRTLILTNRAQLESLYSANEATQVMNKLDELAKHPDVQGLVIQVEDNEIVAKAYEDRAKNYGDHAPGITNSFRIDNNDMTDEQTVTARNTVDTWANLANGIANSIKTTIILRNWNEIEYIVIVGDDRVILACRKTAILIKISVLINGYKKIW